MGWSNTAGTVATAAVFYWRQVRTKKHSTYSGGFDCLAGARILLRLGDLFRIRAWRCYWSARGGADNDLESPAIKTPKIEKRPFAKKRRKSSGSVNPALGYVALSYV